MNSARARRTERLFLALLLLVGLGLRAYRLGQPSLAEDEAAKWNSIQKYRRGQFAGVNSEHPMLMKVLAWASLDAGERYNRWALGHGWHPIRKEALLRLPIALLGALTALILYLLGRQMIGLLGAGLAAVFWAVSPLSVALNRVLKEESLFVFFTLLAFYCYNRGKQAVSAEESKRWFTLAGVAFGLDLASYYLAIGEFGLIVLVWHVANQKGIKSRDMGPYLRRLVLVAGMVFVLANPVILSPRNLEAMLRYSEQKTIQHHGYLMDGRVYLNNALTTPYGLPWYFYLWVLAVKTPLVILAVMLGGIGLLFFDRNSLISIFTRVNLTFWILPYSLAGSKWIRYEAIGLPVLYLAGGWAVEKFLVWSRDRMGNRTWRPAMAVVVVSLVLWPLANAMAWAPYDRLFLNRLGGGMANAGRLFPPDEVYDLGAREVAEYVCRVAPQGARVAASDPMGLGFYMRQLGRKDLKVVQLFDPNYLPQPGDFLLIQDSRRYFETQGLIVLVEKTEKPVFVVRDDGLSVGKVYRFTDRPVRNVLTGGIEKTGSSLAPKDTSGRRSSRFGSHGQ
ncbi:MAG: phospholipid carrier-dependent glycosyltransferase [Acidobacteriota bacterium]|nr:phospholipid carrier-dependent glycosyltransferase [Acidobacteriota bacterium]